MLSIKIIHKEEHEADILLKNENFELLCYCTSDVNNLKDIYLDTLFTKNIFKSEVNKEKVIKLSDYYAYHLCREVIDIKKQLVSLGEFKIYLDSPLPGDIRNGDFVEFDVMHLDI